MSDIIKESNTNWGSSNGKRWEDYDTIVCPDGQTIDMQKLLDDQNRAKAALLHLQPFFAAFIGKLRPIYTFKIQTQATDGVNLFINPQFTYNLDLTEKVFVMAHEIMHCVLNHLRRGRGHNPQRSNIAADYECNITLSDANGCMGLVKQSTIKKIGGYIDNKYNGWGYEKIYLDCKDSSSDSQNNSKQQNQADQNQKGDKGQGQQSSNQNLTPDYITGWNQAMEDYKNGKLKL